MFDPRLLKKFLVSASVVSAGAIAYKQALQRRLHTQKEKRETRCVHHVVVIGGGVVGVSTAYQLRKRGYAVTLIEGQPDVALECSQAAAGAMPRSHPVTDMSFWIKTFGSLLPSFSRDTTKGDGTEPFPYFYIKWGEVLTDLHFVRWAARFIYTTLIRRSEWREASHAHMLAFTDNAITEMEAVMQEDDGKIGNAASHDHQGLTFLHHSQSEIDGATKWKDPARYPFNEDMQVLTRTECLMSQPWLKDSLLGKDVLGATVQTTTAHASSPAFTQALAERCREMGVEFRTGVYVQGFELQGQHNEDISGLQTSKGAIRFDSATTDVVVAAGSWTPVLLRKLGLYVPIYPMRGYSLVTEISNQDSTQSESRFPNGVVVDGPVWSAKYGNELRVTSIGEFAGWSPVPNPLIAQRLQERANVLFPAFEEDFTSKGRVIVGLRPFVADEVAIVGPVTEYSNLHIACGQGATGFKTAMGTAILTGQYLTGDRDVLEKRSFDTDLLSPEGRVIYAPLFSKVCDVVNSVQGRA